MHSVFCSAPHTAQHARLWAQAAVFERITAAKSRAFDSSGGELQTAPPTIPALILFRLRCKTLVELLRREESRQLIRNSDVVKVREGEMRVSSDPDLRQMHNGDITAPTIHCISPEPRHRQTDTPTVLT